MRTSRLEDSGLVTTGKHHLPGYGGFCPQMKFNYGKTFGKTTAALLSDQDIARSGKLVLGPTTPEPENKDKIEEFRSYLIDTRDGDNKYGNAMVPGYMGFVPRTKNYFGSRYTDVCRNSTADLELDRRKVAFREKELEFIKGVQDGTIEVAPEDMPPHLLQSPRVMSRNTAANTPRGTPKPALLTPEPRTQNATPCDALDEETGKTFKAGYAGFVPRSRELFGQVHHNICNEALSNFQDDRRQHQHLNVPSGAATPRNYKVCETPSPRPLYPQETGMTPRYTGHIPGVRFRHGMTFGRSTKNTKDFQMPDISI